MQSRSERVYLDVHFLSPLIMHLRWQLIPVHHCATCISRWLPLEQSLGIEKYKCSKINIRHAAISGRHPMVIKSKLYVVAASTTFFFPHTLYFLLHNTAAAWSRRLVNAQLPLRQQRLERFHILLLKNVRWIINGWRKPSRRPLFEGRCCCRRLAGEYCNYTAFY